MNSERERYLIDVSRKKNPGVPNHAAPEGAEVHPLIDLNRDPHLGVPNHARDDED